MKDQVGGNQKRDRFQALCQSLRPDLMVLAHEPLSKSMQFDEQGYRGGIDSIIWTP